MKTWGVIPARYGSTRFPGKPLVKILDKTLIQWVIELSKKNNDLNHVIVATDHKLIFDHVQNLKTSVVMTNENCQSGTDRIFEALQDQGLSDDDVVINIQGDEPLLPSQYISVLIDVFKRDSELPMASLCHSLTEEDMNNTNAVKVLLNQNSEAIYFSRYNIPFSRASVPVNLSKLPDVQKHIGLYGYRYSFLKQFCKTQPCLSEKSESLEQLRALHLGARIKMISVAGATIGVDRPEDILLVEAKLKECYEK